MTGPIGIHNPGRQQITEAIKQALDAAPNRSELARQLGVSRKQTYQWEAGNNLPSLDTLARLAELTGQTISLHFGPDLPPQQEEAAPPDWAKRLEQKIDEIRTNQNVVANNATAKVTAALAPLDQRLTRISRIARRLEALPPLSDEASDDPLEEEDRVGESPAGPDQS